MPIFGWKPVEEIDDAEDSEFETLQCPFSVAALDAWLEGNVSARLVQHLALMVVLHPTHPEIAELASVGGAGSNKNTSRDLSRLVDRLMANPLPAPTKVACPIIDAKTQKQFNGFLDVFEPDSLLEGLSAYEDFDEIMGLDCVSDFWKAVRPDDPRLIYLQLEAGLTSEDLQKTIPLFVHGDKVEVSNDDSVMVWHFGSILTSVGGSLYTGMLLGIAPAKIEVKTSSAGLGTWDSVWERWQICFTKLQQGAANLSHRFVIWNLEGDHEHFCNNLKNPHWNKKLFCWDCCASNDDPGQGRRFPRGRCGSAPRDLMAEHHKRISDHAAYKIPGVSSHNNCHDALHNLYAHGVGNHACGSALHSLCYRHPGRQPVPPQTTLASIFSSAQILWTNRNSPTRMTNLSLNMFTDIAKPHVGHQSLKSKAAECKHFIPVLSIICRAVADGSEYDEHRACLLEGLAAFGRLMDESPIVPTDSQAEKAITIMQDVLTHADWLKQTSLRNGSDRFHIAYKHHFFQHLAEQFKFMNPRFAWCFKAEDYVGKIAILVHSCSFGTRSIDLPGKALAKWRNMLHFKLSQKIHIE